MLTPPGGGIEVHTSLVTLTIANNDVDAYLFEGIMREGNKARHIMSENFDDDVALEMLKPKQTVVAVRGRGMMEATVYLGGWIFGSVAPVFADPATDSRSLYLSVVMHRAALLDLLGSDTVP